MTSLTESRAAFEDRAAEVGLSADDIAALTGSGIHSLARLAFAAVPPGATPSNDQVRELFGTRVINAGVVAATKRLIFEAHTMVVADLKQKVEKGDDPTSQRLNPAEREARITRQRARLTGLTHRGVEEVAFEAYNLVYGMLQQDTLVYQHPNKFTTRQHELQLKKAVKEVSLDGSGSLTVRDKPQQATCDTHGELELVQALRRRALAFDLVGCCSYDAMNMYHSLLIQRVQDAPPPNYAKVCVVQALRADRAAFTRIAEKVRSLKTGADGVRPLDRAFENILDDTHVSFHLLPLAIPEKPKHPPPPLKRKVEDQQADDKGNKPGKKGKGTGKGKKGGARLRVPKELIGKWSQNKDGERLCWAFNMQCGCGDAAPGSACSRGSITRKAALEGLGPLSFGLGRSECPSLVCSGAGRFTAALRACGMKDSFAVDARVEGAVCPIVSLDLSTAEGQKHFLSLLNEPNLVYVHMSPPAGTATRGAGLRDDLHPHGLPSLRGADKVRVNQANRLFEFCARACKIMYMRGILFSVEGPLQSFLWATKWWRDFFTDVPIFATTLHQCMFGHSRKKATLLVHTLPAFLCLQRTCDGKHSHASWDFAKSSAELSYPWALAREMSTLLRKQLLDLGCADAPQSLHELDNLVTGARVYSGVQASKRVLPLVSEFKNRVMVSGCCDPACVSGLERRKVLTEDWTPPAGSTLSVDLLSIPAGSKVLSISTQGVQPDAEGVGLASAGVLAQPPPADAQKCEHLAYEIMSRRQPGELTADDMFEVLSQTPEVLPARARGIQTEDSHQWFSGGYSHGPMVGVRNSTLRCPWTTALACRYVREQAPWHRFGAIAFTVNLLAEPHVDAHNDPNSNNLVLPITSFKRGGLWLADKAGSSPRTIDGTRVMGTVLSFDGGGICFNPRVPHATERWEGDRAVLVAFLPGGLDELEQCDRAIMDELGFVTSACATANAASQPVKFTAEFGVRWSPEEFVEQDAEHADQGLFNDLVQGFDLVGKLPESGFFKKKFRPASMLEADLRQGADRAREATLATVGPADDPVIDEGVLQATLKEVDAGVVEGPIDPSTLPEGATLTRRFGVVQGEVDGAPKVRPIDNYRASRVNAAVTQSEQVTVHTLDVVAGMISSWLARAKAHRVRSAMNAKTWDLKAAYKQLPLSDTAFARDAYFVIYDPRSQKPAVFKQRALPFGSRASVTAQLRRSSDAQWPSGR
ncbi:unnamed protein product [Symbiodinium sp. CCMP2592]|nr:unnamed protein product [Symbiodinium sp. CCMP2592]